MTEAPKSAQEVIASGPAASAAAVNGGSDALTAAQAAIAKSSSTRAAGVLSAIAASMAAADTDANIPEAQMNKRYALIHPRPHHSTAAAMSPPTPLVSSQANPEVVNFLSSTFHRHAAMRFNSRAPSQEMAVVRAVVRLADALPTAAVNALEGNRSAAVLDARRCVRAAGRALGGGMIFNARWPRVVSEMKVRLENSQDLLGAGADMWALLRKLAPYSRILGSWSLANAITNCVPDPNHEKRYDASLKLLRRPRLLPA